MHTIYFVILIVVPDKF